MPAVGISRTAYVSADHIRASFSAFPERGCRRSMREFKQVIRYFSILSSYLKSMVMDSRHVRYKRVIPKEFRLPFTSEDGSAGWTCFTYTIRFLNFKAGTDPIQQSASEFLLLSPQLLDEEVSSISVHLNLPAFAAVDSKLNYCGVLNVSPEKVETVKKFNIWLFHLAMGKCFALPKVSGEGKKNYYVLPCKPITGDTVPSPEELVDWHVVEIAITSSLLYRRKVPFFGGYATLDCQNTQSNEALDGGGLRMRNGIFQEHDLEDAVVTCANNGLPCFVSGILHDLSGSSFCSQSAGRKQISYSDYYFHECKYKLEYPDQPLLKGYRLVRAGNYVRRTSAVSNGDSVKPWETMELPPEVCILHVGLKGKLCRGGMRLPSILHSLEMSLVAAELRNNIGSPLSCFKVQEALTSGACEGNHSYETLELLGDSVLNFIGGVHMYIDFPSCTSELLHSYRHDLVSNRNLYKCGLACGLPGYIFAELLNTKTWVPPGPALEDLPQKSPDGQVIGLKTLADVVEALIGVTFLHGDLNSAVKTMVWLQVPIPFPEKIPEVIIADIQELMEARNTFKDHDIVTLEKKIGYQFKCKSLLLSAFDYGDEVTFTQSGVPRGSFQFQRLEFLGDSVLDFLIMRHFVQLYSAFNPEQLNDLRQATVNSENFACTAIRHGFHHYLKRMSPILRDEIELYAASVHREGGSPFGIPSRASPKAIGDLMQTLAGSILLDSNFDHDLVWKIEFYISSYEIRTGT
ncbi:endoribonuclease Dicer homolog 1 isoform X2 [Physcomitrium patens]|uniref:endoribonuclease Dicer homolog 1 isoform X2 n=1 Tax=Physcomitrium patens TaxID=3218 RepID=UPI000D15B65C|nr:endoribonuclease Dicer homolog 3a-like isoform X4 [Physcomitrium patens]|eukprot:XP_024363925.1 endoribonuclease Dicer homolog 3a-like isoform X4 [Physcomitrella patens]